MNEMMLSLLDSGSMGNLMQQDYFNHYFRLWLKPVEGLEADAHNIFDFKSASSESIPLSRYIELDMEFFWPQGS